MLQKVVFNLTGAVELGGGGGKGGNWPPTFFLINVLKLVDIKWLFIILFS